MEEYYFLFAIAFIYIIFASIQDLRKREVANWLNFSLVAFALAYRAIYSSFLGNYQFLLYGLIGFGIFFLVGNLLYYTKIFGGGDVKLLMGVGAFLPYFRYSDLFFVSIFFLALLFLGGAIYSLLYSLFLVIKNYSGFKKEFVKGLNERRKLVIFCILFAFGLLVIGEIFGDKITGSYNFIWNYEAAFVIIIGLLYIYLKSLENSCMIKLVEPSKLTEGDWLERDVRIGNKTIKKTVHGLSKEEIKLIRKANKKVLIRYGVPFVPAFLIALIIMVFALIVLRFDFESFLSSLF